MSESPDLPRIKAFKANKGLLNKVRFKKSDQEKTQWLRGLSWRKALQLEESLLSSELIWECRKNFVVDNPICLKKSLGTNKKT